MLSATLTFLILYTACWTPQQEDKYLDNRQKGEGEAK